MDFKINESNLDQWCFDYVENQLNAEDKLFFEQALEFDENIRNEYAKWEKTIIQDLASVSVDPNLKKDILTNNSNPRVMKWIIPTMILLATMGFYNLSITQDLETIKAKKTIPHIVIDQLDKIEPSEELNPIKSTTNRTGFIQTIKKPNNQGVVASVKTMDTLIEVYDTVIEEGVPIAAIPESKQDSTIIIDDTILEREDTILIKEKGKRKKKKRKQKEIIIIHDQL